MEQDDLIIRAPGQAGKERFRRTQRLRSPRDFQRVRRLGRNVSGPLLTLSYAPQASTSGVGASGGRLLLPAAPASVGALPAAPAPTRIGFSVSKRVGDAVTRNRVKRRLREAVRRTLADLPPGWDIVLVARSAAATADYATLDATVRELLARARLTHV